MTFDKNDVVRVAIDAHKGSLSKYSVGEAGKLTREALIKANNGSTKLDYRAIRDGKCNGLFSIVEEILANTISIGVQQDPFFNALIDFRNLAEGDRNIFEVANKNLFVVSEAADGTQGIRRQRIGDVKQVPIDTTVKIVRIYEDLNRVLSGAIDFNEMIDKVGKSFLQKLLLDAYDLWKAAAVADLGTGNVTVSAGAYDESTLLDMIAAVEASAGGDATATLIGTKKALRKLTPSIQSVSSREDFYNFGFTGKFFGSPVVALPQRYKAGTTTNAFSDTSIAIVAGDAKPVKVVYEGDPLILAGNPLNNADLTQEYVYAEKYGMGIVVAGNNAGVGRYDFTT